MNSQDEIKVGFVSYIRYLFTEYRERHPYLFLISIIAFLWVSSLHIYLISGWEAIAVFVISLSCFLNFLFILAVWGMLERRNADYNREIAYKSLWKKIRMVAAIFVILSVICLIIITWSASDDATIKKCISTTISILSLLIGGNVTWQIVRSGAIYNAPVNYYQRVPLENEVSEVPESRVNNTPIDSSFDVDYANIDSNGVGSYNKTINIDE